MSFWSSMVVEAQVDRTVPPLARTSSCLTAARNPKRGYPVGTPCQYLIDQHDDSLSATSPPVTSSW